MNISWGIGIEHEVVMIRNIHDTVSGKLIKKNITFSEYNDEYIKYIHSQIRSRSNYTLYHDQPFQAVRVLQLPIILNDAARPKYKALVDLFHSYYSLFQLYGHYTKEQIIQILFESIHTDSTIQLKVPEFVTPDIYYANKPISIIVQEMVIKQKIILEMNRLENTPTIYAPYGFIYPIESDGEYYIDYGGSYHLNMSLPYDTRLLSEEEHYYNSKNKINIKDLFNNVFNWDELSPLMPGGKNKWYFMGKLEKLLQTDIYDMVIRNIDIPQKHLLKYKKELDISRQKYNKIISWITRNKSVISDICGTYQNNNHDLILQYLYIRITSDIPRFYVKIDDELHYLMDMSWIDHSSDIYEMEFIEPFINAIKKLNLFGNNIDQIPGASAVCIRFHVIKTNISYKIIPECSYDTSDQRIYSGLVSNIDYFFENQQIDSIGGGPNWLGPISKLKHYLTDSLDNIENKVSFMFDTLYGIEQFMLSHIKNKIVFSFRNLIHQNEIYLKYTTSNYHKLHHEWAVSIQWLLPLLMSTFSSCDPFSIGDNNTLTELSFRIFISGYNFVNLTDLKKYYLPTNRYIEHYRENSRLKKKVDAKFNYNFNDELNSSRGTEFRVENKGFNFGFELRVFDNFNIEYVGYLIEFLFLLADHIHTIQPDGTTIGMVPENPFNNKKYDEDIIKILAQGWNTPMPHEYMDALLRNLKFDISVDILHRHSRNGASSYTYDVINVIYDLLQDKFINFETGKGIGKYSQYVIDGGERPYKLPNINRHSWTNAFHNLYWEVTPHTKFRKDIEIIVEKIHLNKKKTHIDFLRKELKSVLRPQYKFKFDIDDVIYTLEDLQVLNLIKISGLTIYNGEWRLPG